MELFKEWLSDHRDDLKFEQVYYTMESLNRNRVAVSACGVFTISYSVIGSVSKHIIFLGKSSHVKNIVF